jgi:hypothetical protein
MRGLRWVAGAVLAAGLTAGVAEAQVNRLRLPANPAGVEKKDTGAVMPSKTVEKKVAKLTSQINWLSSLDEAKELAQKQKKPIFWLHALGDLEGEC